MTTKPLHILMLADAVFEDIPGGSRVVARELAKGLTAHGHHVTFLVIRHSRKESKYENQGGIRIVRYRGAGNPLKMYRTGKQAAQKLWNKQPFDLVHTHFAYAALGPLAALPKGIPHVRSFYGPWDAEGWVEDTQHGTTAVTLGKAIIKRAVRHQVEKNNLGRSALTAVLSEHSKAEVLAFGYPEKNIRVIPGGADTRRFTPPADKKAVRQELGLPLDTPVLLTVRRLAPRMGLENLVCAMPAVLEQHPDTLLLIGGKGPEKEALAKLIVRLRLQKNVQLLGFIPDDHLASYYQAADAFVLPTLALEGFGLVTAESLACGTPVLGTPIGAIPEVLNSLEKRLVFADSSPESIGNGINSFLNSPNKFGLTPEHLHQFVRENYSWSAHITGMEAVYAEAIARAGKTNP